MSLLLGCIADDFTGATDLANNLVRAGMRVVQTIGVPTSPLPADCNAVVVALKSRTITPADAVKQSLQALAWLQKQQVQQVYFKYCSTFDSWYSGDVRGNIGPVTEALMDALSCPFTIATPAFPDNQRTVFKGHLFVGDALLSDSGMKNHPLTPMKDANLVNVLQAQCQRKVGLIDFKTVALGATAVTARIAELQALGVQIAVVDALSNDDLYKLGPALKGMALVTAGSGVAIALPANWGIQPSAASAQLPPAMGLKAIVSGSCSLATQGQVAHFLQHHPQQAWQLDPLKWSASTPLAELAAPVLQWAQKHLPLGPVLVYSTADAEQVKAVQTQLGQAQAGERMEQVLAHIAQGLVAMGVAQLVVAGGETSGACVQALQVTQMHIGAQIDPGVPWCHAHSPSAPASGLHLTLKSGNFGTSDFFSKAFQNLHGPVL
jgi:3-dehydrotetronate 4-kinase